MTVIHLNHTSKRTPGKMRGYFKPHRKHRELLFGLAVATVILGIVTASAFNGGFSMEAGQLKMTLDASISDGLHLRFSSL